MLECVHRYANGIGFVNAIFYMHPAAICVIPWPICGPDFIGQKVKKIAFRRKSTFTFIVESEVS